MRRALVAEVLASVKGRENEPAGKVFKNVQLEGSNTISHQQRFQLEDLLVSDPNAAIDAIEQAYLQIARAISTAKRPT